MKDKKSVFICTSHLSSTLDLMEYRALPSPRRIIGGATRDSRLSQRLICLHILQRLEVSIGQIMLRGYLQVRNPGGQYWQYTAPILSSIKRPYSIVTSGRSASAISDRRPVSSIWWRRQNNNNNKRRQMEKAGEEVCKIICRYVAREDACRARRGDARLCAYPLVFVFDCHHYVPDHTVWLRHNLSLASQLFVKLWTL